MKISCQSCAAKYTIADEKVVGKVIKIKCKKCSATIVVNGNDPASLAASDSGAQVSASAASFEDNATTQLFNAQGGDAPNPDEWTVSVTDDDQRTMTTAQVIEACSQGQLAPDTYVWKDGMADWLALSDVPEFSSHLAPAGGGMNGNGTPPAPPSSTGGFAYETTAAMPAPMAAAAAPAAARRAGGRAIGGDLFGARDSGRGLSAGAATAAAESAAHNIGERNETSVLFSLAALNAAEESAKKIQPKDPFKTQSTDDRIDDILSLGGMSAAPVLAPPPLNAPIIEAPPPPRPVSVAPPSYGGPASAMPYQMAAPPQKKGAPVGIIIGVLGGLAAIGMLVFMLTRSSGTDATKTADTSKPAETTEPQKAETAKPVESVAMIDTNKPADTAAPTDTTAPADSSKADPVPTGPMTPAQKAAFDAALKDKKDKEAAKKDDKKDTSKDDKKDTSKDDKNPPAAGTGDFDRGAASAQLSAKAGGASGCKKPDGPTGSSKVQVTFAPSGRVTQATVGAPFAGTPTGSCIAGLFKGASIPPFAGAPVTVSKTVSVK